MLLIKRKLGQRVIITDEQGRKIEIKVTLLKMKQVEIGVEAPMEFKILREELTEEKE